MKFQSSIILVLIAALTLLSAFAQNSSSLDPPAILSDTQGYDFGRYLNAVITKVRSNWFSVMPESARLGQKGRVLVRFTIVKDGKVQDLKAVLESGNQALDRAAVAAVQTSNPFPALPDDFKGERIVLQFPFLYNMKSDEAR